MSRLGEWWGRPEAGDRATFAGLGALLLAGAGLRGAVTFSAPPLLGFPDSQFYIGSAADQLFSDPGHTAGYAVFLRVLHTLDPHLLTVVLVQHLLGLATGVLLFLILRRARVPGLASLLPAAVILLAGPVLMLEQAPLSEALFAFLQAGAIYAALRTLDGRALPWAVAAGALAALTVLVRPIALISLLVIVAWLLVVHHGPLLRRAAPPAIAALTALALLGGYVAVQHHHTGRGGLVQASGWYVYARAAPFAECEEFTPPSGTEHLCQRSDPSDRPGPNDYIFDVGSPAVQAYGAVHVASASANAELGSFGRAAMLHQPLAWLGQVLSEELPRYVSSGRVVREDQGMDFELLADTLATPASPAMAAQASGFYRDAPEPGGGRDPSLLTGYERWTRIDGVVAVLLMLLALAGGALTRGRQRAVCLLLAAVAFGGMIGSGLTLFYDARYSIVTWGPLAGAAGIGAGAVRRLTRPAGFEPATSASGGQRSIH